LKFLKFFSGLIVPLACTMQIKKKLCRIPCKLLIIRHYWIQECVALYFTTTTAFSFTVIISNNNDCPGPIPSNGIWTLNTEIWNSMCSVNVNLTGTGWTLSLEWMESFHFTIIFECTAGNNTDYRDRRPDLTCSCSRSGHARNLTW
jgi:hypothetical protein